MPTARYIHDAAEFQANVTLGAPETKFLDFKQTLNDWQIPAGEPDREARKRVAQKELCRDVAQFANTQGGCLVVGVAERLDPTTRLKVAERFVGVSEPDQMRQWIEQAIDNYLTPKTLTHTVDPVRLADGSVMVVVNVQPSRCTVSLWDRGEHTIEYPYRTSHGKAWMNPSEAEAHMESGSRFGRIALEQAVEKYLASRGPNQGGARIVDLVSGVFERRVGNVDMRWQDLTIDIGDPDASEDVFVLNVKIPGARERGVWIPYRAVRDAWVGKDKNGQLAIGLMLSVRLYIQEGGNITMQA